MTTRTIIEAVREHVCDVCTEVMSRGTVERIPAPFRRVRVTYPDGLAINLDVCERCWNGRLATRADYAADKS